MLIICLMNSRYAHKTYSLDIRSCWLFALMLVRTDASVAVSQVLLHETIVAERVL